MRDIREIKELLKALDEQSANSLEAQDLDFKEWNRRSLADAVDLVVEMAICMANSGGGRRLNGASNSMRHCLCHFSITMVYRMMCYP